MLLEFLFHLMLGHADRFFEVVFLEGKIADRENHQGQDDLNADAENRPAGEGQGGTHVGVRETQESFTLGVNGEVRHGPDDGELDDVANEFDQGALGEEALETLGQIQLFELGLHRFGCEAEAGLRTADRDRDRDRRQKERRQHEEHANADLHDAMHGIGARDRTGIHLAEHLAHEIGEIACQRGTGEEQEDRPEKQHGERVQLGRTGDLPLLPCFLTPVRRCGFGLFL